ncbi:uncharacterized protein MONBRDRAFT_38327 [Monosiga brevicollis MX1]|uniref:SH2 domain-containing protein n=1 Tax=Monosiga brevicollis TaxID=81824 RepID=A9V714_MONBE|nr:uncharacterized protein MONBRDRAFT_38327 [Monosiga brevicollis MX1]EDQ86711.1 predicted protein [Monosiga brevicollis MX1]|eukprot:XP_001748547.1 hypothetical protein [Monosiga brevicollis MX1]
MARQSSPEDLASRLIHRRSLSRRSRSRLLLCHLICNRSRKGLIPPALAIATRMLKSTDLLPLHVTTLPRWPPQISMMNTRVRVTLKRLASFFTSWSQKHAPGVVDLRSVQDQAQQLSLQDELPDGGAAPARPPKKMPAVIPVLIDLPRYANLKDTSSILKNGLGAQAPPALDEEANPETGQAPAPPRPPKTASTPTVSNQTATPASAGASPARGPGRPQLAPPSSSAGGSEPPRQSYDWNAITDGPSTASKSATLTPIVKTRNATRIIHVDKMANKPPVNKSATLQPSFSTGFAQPAMPRSNAAMTLPPNASLQAVDDDIYGDYDPAAVDWAYWQCVHTADRQTSESILTDYAYATGDNHGLYLMRHSGKVPGAIVISMHSDGKNYHYQFLPTHNGTFLDDKMRDRGTISQLVAYYEAHREGLAARLRTCLGPL